MFSYIHAALVGVGTVALTAALDYIGMLQAPTTDPLGMAIFAAMVGLLSRLLGAGLRLLDGPDLFRH